MSVEKKLIIDDFLQYLSNADSEDLAMLNLLIGKELMSRLTGKKKEKEKDEITP